MTPRKTSEIIGIPPKTIVTKRHAPSVDSGLYDTINVPPPVKKPNTRRLKVSFEAHLRPQQVLI
jgi:hypothetical protein